MNILLISPYFRPMVGGVETHLDDLCSFFNKRKHNIFVRTYQAFGVKKRGVSNERSRFVNIHRLWWPDFNLIFLLEKYPLMKFMYIFTGLFIDCFLFLIGHSRKINVIQAHGFIAAFIGIILGKLFNKKVIINTHVGFNLSENLMTKLIKWTLLSSDRILVLTKGVKKSLVDLGIPEEKIIIYHYWVDQERFKKIDNAKEKLGWANKFVSLFVGRLIEVKGVRTIFKLAEMLPKLTFVIAGSGPLELELKKKSKEYRNINFLGKISNEDLPLYYSASDILLIPSKIINQEYEEGIPRVMIEALSCGLPVITTPAGGIPDVFSPNTGMMVDDNMKQLKKALEKVYVNEGILKEVARNARPFAKDVFGIKNAEIIEKSLQESS